MVSAVNPSDLSGRSHSSHQVTPTKVVRAALYALSVGSIVGPGIFFSKQKDQSIDWKFAVIAFPSLVSSLALIRFAWNLKDYKDPKELRLMRKQAVNLSFDRLFEEHGLKKIEEYSLVSPELLEQKFRKKCEKGLSSVIKKYSFPTIMKHNIFSRQLLRELFYREMKATQTEHLDKDFLQDSFLAQVITEEEKDKLGAYRDSADAVKGVFQSECDHLHQRYLERRLKWIAGLSFQEAIPSNERKKLEMIVLNLGADTEEKYKAELRAANNSCKENLTLVQRRFEDQVLSFMSLKE